MTTTDGFPSRVLHPSDPIPDIDLADPDPARAGALDQVFTDLRPTHPVFWHRAKSRPGFWAVIGYAATMQVYRDSGTFSARHGMTIDSLRPDQDPASGMMVEVTDPPEHRRLRRSVGAFFADGVVTDLTPVVDAYVRRLLVEVRERGGTVDFVEAVAAKVPTHAAGLLLGLPLEDLDWITARTAQVFLSGSGTRGDLREAAEQANGELLSYFAKQLRKRGAGDDSLVRRLAAGTANREALSTGEAVLNALNLAIGGTTTTRSVLTNLMEALLRFPETFQALRDEPSAVPSAVEEAVRWANPVRHLARVATRDTELAGMDIRAGDPVLVWPRSANRDESVFAEPHRFDIHRRPNAHIGFAAGPHSCPGTGLARVQLRAVLGHMLDLFSAAEPAGPGELMQSNFLHGYTRLPVRFTPAS
ncbi:cytochrome P450 [Sphaerisporangium rubeum]|uniref:Cytochrome P450 n=1 Tax=Sphaerisporangium rubeum TaxID=321317 RepID=A0A7X0I958_9ACTN|nr:cytochrome P450 [Sphaerisporangium rubeum]MBB6470921.1 cytochrome P450 [Sphaerisporangium rubeum]